MTSDDSSQIPAPSERRGAVREKAQLVRAKQKRTRAIRIASLATLGVAVVAAGAIAVTWAVSSSASRPMMSPANIDDDGFVVSAVTGVAGVAVDTEAETEGEPAETPASPTPTPSATEAVEGAVDIRVYVDYLSVGSREFQLANVQQLREWVSEDAVSLTYHPVSMLTAKSNGTRYSLRAAAAAACVANHSPETFFAFNDALLRQQPDVESGGLTDAELADLAQASGATPPKVVRACIEEQDYTGWVRTATDRALEGLPETDGLVLTGTPMVLVNGTPYVGALDDPQEFSQFVLTVASDSYYATPTPTPTPTP